MTPQVGRVLVIGATGSIGRLVVARLSELGDHPRALTRDARRARRVLDPSTEIVGGDLTDPAGLSGALDGVAAVVMVHGARYGSGDYEAVDYGAVPALLTALAGRSVRVALMTSIGVTSHGGSPRELLDWKHRGERLLRVSGLPYTVVRPGWFDAGNGQEQHIDLRQGDRSEYGPVRREHVAEVLVQALRTPSAVGRTVEVFSTEGSPVSDWPGAFAAATADRPGSLDGAEDQAGVPLDGEPERFRRDLERLSAPDRTSPGKSS
jgi:uncharacterized protein YbjT (DUF2867 family)